MRTMKKALKLMLIGLATVVIVLTVALPFAAPPVVRSVGEGLLADMGYPSKLQMELGYAWNHGPEIAGNLQLSLSNTPWKVQAEFGAGFGEWHASVKLPKTRFSESDPLVAKLLREHPIDAVSNLVFSGTVALHAAVERTRDIPVPVWTASVPIRDVSASCQSADMACRLDGLSVTPTVSGIARHVDIAPAFLRIEALSAAGFALSNLTASIRASEKALMVTSAQADVCGGQVNIYSAFLDPKSLNAGTTLFLENIDAGEVLNHVSGFSGAASGRLHGKVRVFLKEGAKALRLSDAFLYSTPGETGKIQMENPEALSDNLAYAGLDAATRDNVSDALTNLDFSVLRFDLRRTDEKSATLSIRVEGSATRGDLTVPVNLNININGEIEQLINTGLGYSQKLKGTKK